MDCYRLGRASLSVSEFHIEKKAAFIKAMAHPVRLEMLEAMQNGELCVCELQALSGLDMSTVSKHLSVMKNVGLVNIRKDKNKVFYSLACPCVLNFTKCIDGVIS